MEPKRIVTEEEYQTALAEMEKMNHGGGIWQTWAGHLSTAMAYEEEHGLRNSFLKMCQIDGNLDATQCNTVERAEWRWDGRFLTRYLLDNESGEWIESDLSLPDDRIDSIDGLLFWMEHMGIKSRISKRDMISIVRGWAERFLKSSTTAVCGEINTRIYSAASDCDGTVTQLPVSPL